MDHTNLFLDAEPLSFTFEKNAAEVTLPEDPNSWTNEILQELYKQTAYIADFNTHIVMDRVDAEKGYAFGHVEVTSKTESPAGAPPAQEQAAGIRRVRIPIIVRERKLYPFDIIITESSKMLPLTEQRLRQSLFRPQMFDVTSKTPGDISMIGQLYPPYRQNYGFGGGGGVANIGMGKQGSKTASVLAAIMPSINEQDFLQLTQQLDDQEVKLAFLRNEPAARALALLSSYQPVDREKRAFAIANALNYDVAQVTRDSGAYRLKVASHHMWAPIERMVDRGQLVALLGTKVALAVDQAGSVTMAEGAEGNASPEGDQAEPIKDFGIYRVETAAGRSLVGYVFPNLIDVDGTSLPLALFTNGSEYAMQADIAGVKAGEGQAIPEGPPRGHGLLFRIMPNGKAEATVPLEIKTSLDEGEGVQFMATSFSGDQVRLVPAPNVKNLTAAPGGAVLMPDDMRWLTLDQAKEVQLAEKPEEMGQKMSNAHRLLDIEIRSGSADSFSLSGLPVEKLGHAATQQIGLDEAVFLLAGYGIQPEYAFKKLGESIYAGRPIVVPIRRMLKTAAERTASAMSTGQQILELMPQLRQPFLVKEAAVIPDTTAVDTVLSLGFLNSENMLEFLKALPVLDDTQSRMCELLFGARVGLKEIPAGALEKAIKATESVIEGLRIIAFQEN